MTTSTEQRSDVEYLFDELVPLLPIEESALRVTQVLNNEANLVA